MPPLYLLPDLLTACLQMLMQILLCAEHYQQLFRLYLMSFYSPQLMNFGIYLILSADFFQKVIKILKNRLTLVLYHGKILKWKVTGDEF